MGAYRPHSTLAGHSRSLLIRIPGSSPSRGADQGSNYHLADDRSWPNPAGQGREQTRFPICYNGASMIVGIALKRHEEGFDSPAHVTLRVILN